MKEQMKKLLSMVLVVTMLMAITAGCGAAPSSGDTAEEGKKFRSVRLLICLEMR